MHARAPKLSAQFPATIMPRSKVWLEVGGRFAIGEGGIALFEAVRRRGSLRQAAAAVGWSYRHAWDYVKKTEAVLGLRLIEREPARPREGSALTGEGDSLLQGLRRLQEAVRRATERSFRVTPRPAMARQRRPRDSASPSPSSR